MKRTGTKTIPDFKTLEEEREYWEARGPLAEGYRGRVSKPKAGQKRSSFLSVRLTGEELTRLRDIAAKQGLGPSTFARLVLTSAIEPILMVLMGFVIGFIMLAMYMPIFQMAGAM